MPKIDVLSTDGKKVKEIELSDKVFGIEPNEEVVHSVVVNYLANQRQGTQSTKTRAEVRGGGKKPWRQKGTGRARQGSIRAPQCNLNSNNALVVLADKNENVQRSVRNLPTAKVERADSLNVYDLLKFNKIVLTEDSVKKIEEVYA